MYQSDGRRRRSRVRSIGKPKRKSPRRPKSTRRKRRVAKGRKGKMMLSFGEPSAEVPASAQQRVSALEGADGGQGQDVFLSRMDKGMPFPIKSTSKPPSRYGRTLRFGRPSGRAATPPRVTSLSPRYASQPQPQPEPSAEEGAPSPTPRVPKGVTPEPSKPPPIWWKNPENGERSKKREKLENQICEGLVQIIESVSKGDIDLLSLGEETPLNTILRTVNEKVGSKVMTFLDGVIGGKEWGMEKNSQHPPGVLSGVVIDYKGEDVTRKKQIKIPGEAEARAAKFLPYF